LAIKISEDTNIIWDPECFQFQCFNHILNLAAQAALDRLKEDVVRYDYRFIKVDYYLIVL
ncbi:12993_t:CDS:1, partial [Cetraspora pellucida]